MAAVAMRRADFLMMLAYASDLATGHSRDFALRSCVVAMRLAALLKLSDDDRRAAYHLALLRFAGCNADTDMLSGLFGDEIALRQDLVGFDMGDRAALGQVFVQAFRRRYFDLDPTALEKAIAESLAQAAQVVRPVLAAHCEVAQRIGARLGLPDDIRRNLGQIYERLDGKGLPHGVTGEAVLPAVRLVTLAQDVVALTDAKGLAAMAETIASRADGPYDGAWARVAAAHGAELMAGVGATVERATILDLEPAPVATMDATACDEAFLAVADMVDMRMPVTMGHARAVAALAEGAGRDMGLPEGDVRALRWAALVHDLGELAVPVSTWMREGPLTPRERDAAHLHPYYGERALAAFGPAGESLAALVARHHERLDGSGYHRKAGAADLPPAARVLAAAEAFETLREERPHRKALPAEAAAAKLRADVREGRLCPVATEAVLKAAGQPSRRAAPRALSGMTPREVEVLRLIAAGLTAKETARRLDISPKTADHHIQSLYAKIGVTTRAAAALYAVENGVLRAGEPA